MKRIQLDQIRPYTREENIVHPNKLTFTEKSKWWGTDHHTDEENGGCQLVHPFSAADEVPLLRDDSNCDPHRYIYVSGAKPRISVSSKHQPNNVGVR